MAEYQDPSTVQRIDTNDKHKGPRLLVVDVIWETISDVRLHLMKTVEERRGRASTNTRASSVIVTVRLDGVLLTNDGNEESFG